MSEKQARAARVMLEVLYVGLCASIVCWLYVPGFRYRVKEGVSWARYYGGIARWRNHPVWLQEALIVRGLHPSE